MGYDGRSEDFLPRMDWYPQDYLADRKTWGMTLAEHGLYFLLLNFEWLDGPLPADLAGIQELLPNVPEAELKLCLAKVKRCFEVADGRMTSPRLERERKAALTRREERRKAGRKGGLANKKRSRAKAKPKQKEAIAKQSRSPSPSPSPSYNDGETVTEETESHAADERPAPSATARPAAFATGAQNGRFDWTGWSEADIRFAEKVIDYGPQDRAQGPGYAAGTYRLADDATAILVKPLYAPETEKLWRKIRRKE